MFATIRRYESIDNARTDELVKKADETLVPSLSELPGFNGYYLIETGNGVMSSISFFDTSAHADESTRVTSNWVREQKLGDRTPEPAEDHERRGRRAEDGRARPGVTRLRAARCRREGPLMRAFSSASRRELSLGANLDVPAVERAEAVRPEAVSMEKRSSSRARRDPRARCGSRLHAVVQRVADRTTSSPPATGSSRRRRRTTSSSGESVIEQVPDSPPSSLFALTDRFSLPEPVRMKPPPVAFPAFESNWPSPASPVPVLVRVALVHVRVEDADLEPGRRRRRCRRPHRRRRRKRPRRCSPDPCWRPSRSCRPRRPRYRSRRQGRRRRRPRPRRCPPGLGSPRPGSCRRGRERRRRRRRCPPDFQLTTDASSSALMPSVSGEPGVSARVEAKALVTADPEEGLRCWSQAKTALPPAGIVASKVRLTPCVPKRLKIMVSTEKARQAGRRGRTAPSWGPDRVPPGQSSSVMTTVPPR